MKRRHTSGDKEFNPETLALGYGYDPFLSEGSVKPPVFLTSTFQFESAEHGKRFFELSSGVREPDEGEERGLIYSRLNNPNLQIFEERMAVWDGAEMGLTFSSGMAAISTTLLAMARPGEAIISTEPVYGGTHHLLADVLPMFGIDVHWVEAGDDAPELMLAKAEEIGFEKVRVLFLETPANPSNVHTDIEGVAKVAAQIRERGGAEVVTAVDNTFLGPLFQLPIKFGADLVIYSATKFIGGHSDLVAGVVTGPKPLIKRLLSLRSVLGTQTTPFNGWLLLRSLETLSVRMRRSAKNAEALAKLLNKHPLVEKVCYPKLLEKGSKQRKIWKKQCTGPGSLISFVVKGGQEAAYKVLDRFEVFKLAVSLGGTESLVEHPMSMTHADVPPEELIAHNVLPGLIRVSVGLEHLSDLKRDLRWALDI